MLNSFFIGGYPFRTSRYFKAPLQLAQGTGDSRWQLYFSRLMLLLDMVKFSSFNLCSLKPSYFITSTIKREMRGEQTTQHPNNKPRIHNTNEKCTAKHIGQISLFFVRCKKRKEQQHFRLRILGKQKHPHNTAKHGQSQQVTESVQSAPPGTLLPQATAFAVNPSTGLVQEAPAHPCFAVGATATPRRIINSAWRAEVSPPLQPSRWDLLRMRARCWQRPSME